MSWHGHNIINATKPTPYYGDYVVDTNLICYNFLSYTRIEIILKGNRAVGAGR